MNTEYRKNHLIYYIQQITASLAGILITGSVIQSFLLESGCNESRVSIYVSVMQAVQVVTMILISKKMEHMSRIFLSYAVTCFSQILLFIVMLYMSIWHEQPVDVKYIIIFVISLIVSLFQGVNAVITYKIPYFIIDMKRYGRISGFSGVLLGILGVLFSAALSFFVSKYPYFYVMAIFSGLGLLFTTVTGILILNYDNKRDAASDEKSEEIQIFRYKPFYQLLVPNICRGVSNGIFLMMVTIGYFEGVLNGTGTGLMVTISQVATIVGCLLYSVLAGKISEGKIVLSCGILFAIFLPFSFVFQSQKLFLLIYLIVYFFYIIVNYAIPVLIARRIDYRCIGQYSAWRMVIHMGGTALGNAIVPILLKLVGSIWTLIFCGATLLICTFFYYRFEVQSK